MDVRILLLRGINVGGHNRLPMADLRALVTRVGGADVVTHLQSGNVVCRCGAAPADLAAALAEAITATAGLTVPVVARTADQWATTVAANPLTDLDDDPKRLHVTFLDGIPDPGLVADLASGADGFAPERFEVAGADVFLHIPTGYHQAKLSNAFLERRLGRVATTRNWRTVLALAVLAGVDP